MERTSIILEDLQDGIAPTTNTATELGIVITLLLVIF